MPTGSIAVVAVAAALVARAVVEATRRVDFQVLVYAARRFAGREGATERLRKLSLALPRGPVFDLVRGVVGAMDGAAAWPAAEVRERLAAGAAGHERRYFEATAAQPAAELGALVVLGAVGAATAPQPAWAWGVAAAGASAAVWTAIRRRRQVRDVRAGLPALYDALALALTAPAEASPPPSPPPAEASPPPSPPPLTCAACGGGELATGELVPDCAALVCLACGHLEWKVRNVATLLAAGRLRRLPHEN